VPSHGVKARRPTTATTKMTTTLSEATPSATRAQAGKHLTFMLGNEFYGIPVLTVREIIRMVDITSVPRMPEFIRGVINLRGKIIPVLDLRLRFDLKAETTERTCIIVVQVKLPSGATTQTGLIVDAVEEVANIAPAEIEETPDFGSVVDTKYIVGMAKIKGEVKTLLDIDKVICGESLEKAQFNQL
jgi:purine-binding chemotaxis protein CheW